MANNIWSNYTEKTATPVDADEVMVRDSTDGKNKRLLFGTFWKWVAKKLNEATISELETDNKTIIGAINALNGNILNYKVFTIDLKNDIQWMTSSTGMFYGDFTANLKNIRYIVMVDWNGLSASQNINCYIPEYSDSASIQITITDINFNDGVYIKIRVYYNS